MWVAKIDADIAHALLPLCTPNQRAILVRGRDRDGPFVVVGADAVNDTGRFLQVLKDLNEVITPDIVQKCMDSDPDIRGPKRLKRDATNESGTHHGKVGGGVITMKSAFAISEKMAADLCRTIGEESLPDAQFEDHRGSTTNVFQDKPYFQCDKEQLTKKFMHGYLNIKVMPRKAIKNISVEIVGREPISFPILHQYCTNHQIKRYVQKLTGIATWAQMLVDRIASPPNTGAGAGGRECIDLKQATGNNKFVIARPVHHCRRVVSEDCITSREGEDHVVVHMDKTKRNSVMLRFLPIFNREHSLHYTMTVKLPKVDGELYFMGVVENSVAELVSQTAPLENIIESCCAQQLTHGNICVIDETMSVWNNRYSDGMENQFWEGISCEMRGKTVTMKADLETNTIRFKVLDGRRLITYHCPFTFGKSGQYGFVVKIGQYSPTENRRRIVIVLADEPNEDQMELLFKNDRLQTTERIPS